MPAKLEIDREQVRILVVQQGVRETARILGLNENTVSAWSARYGWIAELQARPALPASMVQKRASDASSVADLAVKAYRERRLKTRLLHSQVALENVEHIASQSVSERLADGGQTLLSTVKHAALADNWETDSAQRVTVCIQAGSGEGAISVPEENAYSETLDLSDPMDDPAFL